MYSSLHSSFGDKAIVQHCIVGWILHEFLMLSPSTARRFGAMYPIPLRKYYATSPSTSPAQSNYNFATRSSANVPPVNVLL